MDDPWGGIVVLAWESRISNTINNFSIQSTILRWTTLLEVQTFDPVSHGQ